jgi:tetratricopeptide (TPR) repeat protein
MFGQPAWPMWFVSMCAATLVAVTVTAVLIARRCGYFFTGWFWFLGTLVPVIGLVQVSFQSMADRFAYFPHIGLFVLVAWLLVDATKHFRVPRAIVVSAALASIAACGWLTAQQVRTWHDSETLYRHALVTCPKNWKVNHYLGDYLYYQDQFEASLAQYQAAIALKPDDASALFKAGVVLRDLNRYTEAAESLDKSIQLDPNQGDAHFNLAFVLSRLARTGEARAHLREAVRLQPEQVDRNNSLAAEIEAGTSR